MTLTTVNPALLDTQAQYTGFKNRLFNGNMSIDQRNNGASVTPTSNAQYVLDRWFPALNVSSKYSVQRSAVSTPVGFSYATLITSLSAYSPAAANFFYYGQKIEGVNVADLNWGTASAATIAISFMVRSSLTGSFSVRLINNSFNRSYVTTYTINSANTWEQKTITVPGDTSGTWETNSNSGIELAFDLGSGSDYTTSNTNSWQATAGVKATGSVSVVGTNAATWQVTGVQLEKGSTATSFDYRPYGTEFNLCLRYYWKNMPSYTFSQLCGGYSPTTTDGIFNIVFPVPMRSSPTFTYGGTFQLLQTSAVDKTTFIFSDASLYNSRFDTTGTGLTAGGAVALRTKSDTSTFIAFSAEL